MDKSEIYETRRLNLWRITNTKFRGNKSAVARVVGKDPSYIQRCLASRDKPKRQRKNIGEELAREFELALGLEKYELDAEVGQRGQPAQEYTSMTQPTPMEIMEGPGPLESGEVDLPYYREAELAGGMGRTHVIENHGRSMRFPLAKLAKRGVCPSNAACATLVGNSMEPKIMDGSPIAIDRGCTQIIDGKIYAIDHGGMLRVKYLYRLPLGRIRIASENSEEYPDEIISPPDLDELRIIGRVFWWESFD